MASIVTGIELNDRFSGAMLKVINTVNRGLSAMDALSAEMNVGGEARTLEGYRDAAAEASAELLGLREQFARVQEGIDAAARRQTDFNSRIASGTTAADGLLRKVGALVAAYASLQTAKAAIGAADEWTQTGARLSLIVDDGGSVDDLRQRIFDMAQRSRADFGATAGTVAKLGLLAGDAFSSNDELIRFAELMNKNFVSSGASAQTQQAAMYQLTQALASGRLQGDEYRSILENASLLKDAIEDYMINVRHADGAIKDWAADGKLTADVIKEALFRSADTVEERFGKIPVTFSAAWTMFKNEAVMALSPVLERLGEMADSGRLQAITDRLAGAVGGLANLALNALDMIASGADFAIDNWDKIAPWIAAAATALTVYAAVQAGMWVAANAQAIGITASIVLVIMLAYKLIDALLAASGYTGSTIGFIIGSFNVLKAFIMNGFIVPVQNAIADFVNFFGNAFNGRVEAVEKLFYDLCITSVGYIRSMAEAIEKLINQIPGVEVNITGNLDNLYNRLEEARQKVVDKSGWVEYMSKWGYEDLSDAYDKGYGIGAKIENGFESFKNIFKGLEGPSADGLSAGYAGGIGAGMLSSLESIDANTAEMADGMSASNEELRLLREIAEKSAVNMFTTNEIKVEFTANVSGSTERDLDGIVESLSAKFTEALASQTEGVYV